MKTIPVSLVLAGLMVPGILGAQPDPERREKKRPEMGEGPEKGRGGEGRFGKGWKQADADGNGTISREEFDAFPRVQKLPAEKRDMIFKRLDKNSDGVLSGDELTMDRPPHERREAMMRFRELDTDKSGGVSLEELKASDLFKKLPPEKQQAMFARLDTDGDGEITLKDKPQPPPGRPDGPDRPGKPDREDRPPRDPRRMLRDLDENGDGAISFEEFRKAPPIKDLTEDEQEDRFEALDKNSDKKLDETDFPPKQEKPGKPEEGPKPPKPDGPPPPAGE